MTVKVCKANLSRLKQTHGEQLSKLNSKQQRDNDLLDDIKNFSKHRSAVEKEYAQALLRLAQQYLNKIGKPKQVDEDTTGEHIFAQTLWRKFVEEEEKKAKLHLLAADEISQKVHEPAKSGQKSHSQTSKKVSEQLQSIHEEMAFSVRELAKNKKAYSENEHEAHEARCKLRDAHDRLKRRDVGIFQSMATLQKNHEKFENKATITTEKATDSRNNYILSMAAANAHHSHYYKFDLPALVDQIDGVVYENMSACMESLAKIEVQTALTSQNAFNNLYPICTKVGKSHEQQHFYQMNPVFTAQIQYAFEPVDNDPYFIVTKEHNAELNLDKEARRLAVKIVREDKKIRDAENDYKNLQAGSVSTTSQKSTTSSNSLEDAEQKMEACRELLRKSRTSKEKADARLEALRVGEVDVDTWLASAQLDLLAQPEENGGDISRSPSVASFETEKFDVYELNNEERSSIPRKAITSQTSTTDAVMDFPRRCIVLYSYDARTDEELTIYADELLNILQQGDGDGWLKAQNSDNQIGLIPENYIEYQSIGSLDVYDDVPGEEEFGATDLNDDDGVFGDDMVGDASNMSNLAQLESLFAFPPLNNNHSERNSDVGLQLFGPEEVIQNQENSQGNAGAGSHYNGLCRALYDYEATSNEEISFAEGDIITILRKDDNGVDDGWWEGQIHGKIGAFPSLVVEEISGGQNAFGESDGVNLLQAQTTIRVTPSQECSHKTEAWQYYDQVPGDDGAEDAIGKVPPARPDKPLIPTKPHIDFFS